MVFNVLITIAAVAGVAVVQGGIVPANDTYQIQNVNTKYFMDQYRVTPARGDPVVSRELSITTKTQKWTTSVSTVDGSQIVAFTSNGTNNKVFVTQTGLLVSELLATLFNATRVPNIADPTYWLTLPYSTLAITGGHQGLELTIEELNASNTFQRWQFVVPQTA